MVITHTYMLKKPNYTQRINRIDGWTLNNCLRNCLNDTDDETQNSKFNGIILLTIVIFLIIIYLCVNISISMIEETDILYNKLGIIYSSLIILKQLTSSFTTIIYLNKEIYLSKLQQNEFENLSFSTAFEGSVLKTRQVFIKITIEYFTAIYVTFIIFTFSNAISSLLLYYKKPISLLIFELISSVSLSSIMMYIFVTAKKKAIQTDHNLQDITEILNKALNHFLFLLFFIGLLFFNSTVLAIFNLEQS